MKYVFFGELYHDTIIEANSLDEAYEIIVEKYYNVLAVLNLLMALRLLKLVLGQILVVTTKKNIYPMNVVLCLLQLRQIIIVYLSHS